MLGEFILCIPFPTTATFLPADVVPSNRNGIAQMNMMKFEAQLQYTNCNLISKAVLWLKLIILIGSKWISMSLLMTHSQTK